MRVTLKTATKYINGLQRTREETVIENEGLVRKVAARYEYKAKIVGLDYQDLVSIGNIGLIKAFDQFKDSLGFRFSTYAVPKIKGEITRAIMQTHAGIHYSIDIRRDVDSIQTREMEDSSIEEISQALDMSEKRVKLALEYITQGLPTSIDMRVTGANDTELSTIGDLLGKDHDFSRVIVQEFIGLLDSKEREIVRMLLQKKTTAEIGAFYGTSYQAVLYHIREIRLKWGLYQYGLPAGKTKRKLKKLVNQEELNAAEEYVRKRVSRKQAVL